MRKHLYVDGTDLATFGVYCSGQGTFGAPEKEVTTYTVPGRDGLVLGVNERMENIRVVYPCFIYTNFAENMKNLRSFLMSRSGYVKINDDYDTDHFRMGFFEAGIDPDVTTKNDAGSFNLVFNCQPQRWLNSGETALTKTSSASETITNPYLFASKPLLKIFSSGYGQLSIYPYGNSYDGVVVTIAAELSEAGYEFVYVDCDTMEIYNGATDLSQYVGFSGVATGQSGGRGFLVDPPSLFPGENRWSWTGSITKVELTPRWWEA